MPTNRRLAPAFTKERARQDRAIARRNRLLALKQRERVLIAHAKDAQARGQRNRFNALKMELVQVREKIRQIGGKPEERPLAKKRRGAGGGARQRPGAPSARRDAAEPQDGDVYAPVPDEDEEMPGDVEEEAAGDDWLPFGQEAQAPKKRGLFDFLKADPAKVAARKAAAEARRAEAAARRAASRKPPVTKLGANMAITTRPGFRAAVTEFRPGLYVVAEVPAHAVSAFAGDEFGLLPLLAPLVVSAVATESQRRQQAQQRPQPRQLPGPAPMQPAPASPAAILGIAGEAVPRWVDTQVASDVMGCDGRSCKCGR